MPGYDYVGNAMKSAGYPAFHPPGYRATTPEQSSGPYDPGSALGNANQYLNFNTYSSDKVKEIANMVNQINLNAQKKANEARIPNNPALEKASSANIANELAGKVPNDVNAELSRLAAERGVTMGSPGSANSNASLLRALGLTSLNLTESGQNDLTRADARNPGAPLFDPSSLLMTPAAGAGITPALGNLNLGAYGLISNNQYRDRALDLYNQQNLARNYNPNFNFTPGPSGAPLSTSALFNPGSDGSTFSGNTLGPSSSYSYTPGDGSLFDYTPANPIDPTSGYANTPVSMYG